MLEVVLVVRIVADNGCMKRRKFAAVEKRCDVVAGGEEGAAAAITREVQLLLLWSGERKKCNCCYCF